MIKEDQAQIYRTLKKLKADGLVVQKGRSRGLTVDRKVYEITENGQNALAQLVANPAKADFISCLPQVMQLFFSGVLSVEEQLAFLDKQLKLNNALIQKLKDNYEKFLRGR